MGWFRRQDAGRGGGGAGGDAGHSAPQHGHASWPAPILSADPAASRAADPAGPASSASVSPAVLPGADPVSAYVPAAARPARRPLGRLALLLAASFGALVLGAVAVAAMMVYYTIALPDPMTLRQKERAPVVRILASDGSVLAERGGAHDYMPLDLLPKQVTDAVVATEDRRFYEHWGVDPAGMIRAMLANLRAGRFVQGGSTLTQQLAKNLFLTHERTLTRKVEELLLALWLELRLAKPDILELYLNRVYFGGGAYGIEAAAQRYFDKSARELTLAEAAVVAGLLKAPSKFAPTASPGAARSRGRSVVRKMRDAGYIGAAEEKRALAERVRFSEAKPQKEPTGIEYAVDFVLERMPPLIGAGHAEVVVETTIDAGLQRRAHEIVTRKLAEQGEKLNVGQAAVVLIDLDGSIRALVGGRAYGESQFNRAVKARRQPGSAFKPFVFLAALESGMTPDTIVHDLPVSIEGWTPRNTTGRYQGEVTMRKALAESINTVAARLQFDIGARTIASTARRLGIKSDLREDPSLALGTSEISLLELTGSYGVLANGGALIEPHAIRRVRMSSGRVLYARSATRTDQVLAPAVVGAMNDMLNTALVSGTGRRAVIARHPAAGKTGTTTDFRDALFVGFTSHLAAGVWVGNDNGRPMNSVMGGGLPAEIWRELMTAAHQGRAPITLAGLGSMTAPRTIDEPRPVRDGQDDPEVLPWLDPKGRGGDAAPAPAANRPPAAVSEGPPAASRGRAPAGLAAPAPLPVPTPAAPASRVAAPKPSPKPLPVLPKDRISPDFVARMVEGVGEATQPAPVAGLPSGFDVDVLKSRLRQAPSPPRLSPPGMMSLGSGAAADDLAPDEASR